VRLWTFEHLFSATHIYLVARSSERGSSLVYIRLFSYVSSFIVIRLRFALLLCKHLSSYDAKSRWKFSVAAGRVTARQFLSKSDHPILPTMAINGRLDFRRVNPKTQPAGPRQHC
jgi:hypothetical protein